jgi:hypothetical protein
MARLARCSVCSRTLRAGSAGGPKRPSLNTLPRRARMAERSGRRDGRIQSNKGMPLRSRSFQDQLTRQVSPMSPVRSVTHVPGCTLSPRVRVRGGQVGHFLHPPKPQDRPCRSRRRTSVWAKSRLPRGKSRDVRLKVLTFWPDRDRLPTTALHEVKNTAESFPVGAGAPAGTLALATEGVSCRRLTWRRTFDYRSSRSTACGHPGGRCRRLQPADGAR